MAIASISTLLLLQMKASQAILPTGVALLLLAPLVALMPVFTPPPNGCPCPQGLDVTTPFANAAIVVGILGVLLIAYGGVKRLLPGSASARPSNNLATLATAVSGFSVLVAGLILSEIDLTISQSSKAPRDSILRYLVLAFYFFPVL